MPSLPWACAAVRRPALRASSMAARTSSSVSWAEFGLHARRHHAAGGEDLDDVGAGPELLAHGLAHLVGPVGLAADQLPAVAARDADALARAQHARPGNGPAADGVAHAQLGVVAPAQVAHGGDAGLDRLPRAQPPR